MFRVAAGFTDSAGLYVHDCCPAQLGLPTGLFVNVNHAPPISDAPVTLSAPTVPTLVTTMFCWPDAPCSTLPKSYGLGFTEIFWFVVPTPVSENCWTGLIGSFVGTFNVAVLVPVELGWKVTEICSAAPGVR